MLSHNSVPLIQRFFSTQSKKLLFFTDLQFRHRYQSSLIQLPNSKDLLHKAIQLEKKCDFVGAEKLLEKIIYEVDPTTKEAYDRLVALWGKKSVFGYQQVKVDNLFKQYDTHIAKKSLIDNNKAFSPKNMGIK